MTIYLDYIFIENFLIDYILLKETSYIARRKIPEIRIIGATFIASTYIVIMMFFKINVLNYWLCKMLLAVVVIYISFIPKRIDEYIKLILLFFLVSIINVGTITVITNLLNLKNISAFLKFIVYAISLLLSKFSMKHMWKIYKNKLKTQDLIYEVKINLTKKEYIYKAFLDTGNNVFSYTYDVPVIFAELLDEDMVKELKNKETFSIKTITLTSAQEKQAYIFDNILVKKQDKVWQVKAAIVFENTKISKNNSYNMLLNYILYTQSLGGIEI